MCSSRDTLCVHPPSGCSFLLSLSSAVSDIQLCVTLGVFPVPVLSLCAGTALAGAIPLCSPLAQHLYFHVSLNQDMSPVKLGLVLQEVHNPCWVFFCTSPLAVNMDLAPGFNFFCSSVCSSPGQLCVSPGMLSEGCECLAGHQHTLPLAACPCLWCGKKCPGEKQLPRSC